MNIINARNINMRIRSILKLCGVRRYCRVSNLYVKLYREQDKFDKVRVFIIEVCGGILRGTSGVIESPNYPNSYPVNQTCSWVIIGPTDHTLKLQFRDINLPGFRRCFSTDHIKIQEKFTGNDTSK